MNKKGEIMHWILLGFMLAVGIYFVAQQQPDLQHEVKGTWALSARDEIFLEAQRAQIIQDFQVSQVVYTTLHHLFAQGLVKITSLCGQTNYYPFWNLEEFECFPDATTLVPSEIQSSLQTAFPEQEYKNLQLTRSLLTAQGTKNTLTQQQPFYATYSYNQNLALNLRYDLFETQLIIQQAKELLHRCRNTKELQDCIDNSMPVYFRSKECLLDAKTETLFRVIPFCVTSPNGVGILDTERNLVPLQYKFRLDFTPLTPFVIEELSTTTQQNLITLTFTADDLATGYNLYYTDDPSVTSKKGKPADIRNTIFNSIYQWEKRTLPSLQGCVVEESRTAGNAYLCEDTIHYLVDKNTLPAEQQTLVFAITTTNNNQESEIITWALAE